MILEKLAIDQRMQTQNLVHMLQNRESGYTRNKLSQAPQLSYERQFYKAITPCLTVGIVIPPVYLRKFTPDGSKLLGFSHDQRSFIGMLKIFNYLRITRNILCSIRIQGHRRGRRKSVVQ